MNDETEEYENDGEGSGKSSISADLIRGHINTIILRSLYDRDKYGYEIINEINEKSHGQYTLKQPTLYSALKRLENQGYIQAYWKADEVSSGGRRKYFRLTEAGKEVTEKNQAEWEYSRTVIDNLISDKNFDFNQPAPTPVDFSLLKKTTSRIPSHSDGDEAEPAEGQTAAENAETVQPENTDEQAAERTEASESPYTDTFTFTAVSQSTVILEPEQTSDITEEVAENSENTVEEQPINEAEQPAAAVEETTQQEVTEDTTAEETTQNQSESQESIQQEQSVTDNEQALEEERRRITHENYMRLVSGNTQTPDAQDNVVPGSENINTENLIYNSLPETERNYKNMVEKLFYNTIKPAETAEREKQVYTAQQSAPQTPAPAPQPRVNVTENYYTANAKAANDGLKIATASSDQFAQSAHYTTYNKGATLFKCSLIVGVILLFEFVMCLLFKDDLKISYAYPFVIFALDIALVLVFGILYWAGYGRQVRKPTNQRYILTSAIITIIAILIILIIAVCIVNWTLASDIVAKFIFPIIIALNIPIFTLSFYLLTK